MEYEKKDNFRNDSVYSKRIKAGKRRTYFFDVKSTRANDYFLTITESKKRPDETYERFKIFVYKEDFNKFLESLQDTIDHIKKELMPDFDFDAYDRRDENGEHHYQHPPTSPAAENIAPASEETKKEEPTPPPAAPTAETPPPPPANDDDLKW